MKALILRVVPLMAAAIMTAGVAQAQSAPPGVVVLGQSWDRSRPPSPALYEDPLRIASETARMQDAQKETIRENKDRAKARLEPLPIPQRTGGQTGQPVPPAPDGYVYTYTARVRNDGTRKIRRVDWDYMVFDSAAEREIGTHRFTSKVSVSPGQTKKLSGRTTSPPSNFVDASGDAGGAPIRYSERVVIRRVEYDDGSVWEGTSN
ncbi:MAG: FxLYD domain-containing protein [Pyrinomonadaceae bacterium]